MQKKAQLIQISSKLVLFHANDLLDLRFLNTGNFTPTFVQGSISTAVVEIVNLVASTLEETDLEIELDIDRLMFNDTPYKFDMRRF